MRLAPLLLAAVLMGGCPRDPAAFPSMDEVASDVATDEEVRFIPTFARRGEGQTNLRIEAWVYKPEEDDPVRSAAIDRIQGALGFDADEPTTQRVIDRLRPFMVDNEGDKEVVVRIGETTVPLERTGPDGRSTTFVPVPVPDGAATSRFEVVFTRDQSRHIRGRVHILDDDGVSVISDIDDTIKITEVHDERQLVLNTFARPFLPTPGTAALYQRWKNQGAAFHYVSNSPLPLLDPVEDFIAAEGFPQGSVSLRPFRWRDGTFLHLVAAPSRHKQKVIADIIASFEVRKFVLVGDTGERDPEIYADLRRRFPRRVVKIYLRDTQTVEASALQSRLQSVFEGIPASAWAVFADPSEITESLPR